MKKIFFTITGIKHFYGKSLFEPEMTVRLVKEPDNKYDREAIKAEMEGLGRIGYVANSPYTVKGESYSAGRPYDKIGDEAEGIVKYVFSDGIICYVNESVTSKEEPGQFKQSRKNEMNEKEQMQSRCD
jgi:hypothetical protein